MGFCTLFYGEEYWKFLGNEYISFKKEKLARRAGTWSCWVDFSRYLMLLVNLVVLSFLPIFWWEDFPEVMSKFTNWTLIVTIVL
jgi:hypothetical protein